MSDACPCGSGQRHDACCGPIVAGTRQAGTAEQLMRSRYTAFVVEDEGHLLRSWHPDTRPPAVRFRQRWRGLEVRATSGGGFLDDEGTVEFVARYEGGSLHELSRFERHEGRWVYVGPWEAERRDHRRASPAG